MKIIFFVLLFCWKHLFKNKKMKNKKGAVMVYVLLIASISVTILSGLAIFVTSNQKNSSNEVSRQKALHFAESGVYYYRWYLAHNLDGKNQIQVKDFWENGNPLGVESVYNKTLVNSAGETMGGYEISVEPPDVNSTIVLIEATGWTTKHPHIKRKIKARFRKPSWSEYSVLANDVMRFGEGTSVFGPIHSNNGIRFDGVANNVVTSSVESYFDPDVYSTKPGVWTSESDESQVFLAGKTFPVPTIDFNGVTSDLSLIRQEAGSGGIYLNDDIYEEERCLWYRWRGSWYYICDTIERDIVGFHLTLRTDDKVEVKKIIDYGDVSYSIIEEVESEVIDFPANGLIFSDKHLWVEGQINDAQLTIATADLEGAGENNIYINNDILYTNYDGNDIIGLIAENNITVGYYSEDDLEIDGALLAQKGRVGRDYYIGSGYAYRDEITVRGSIATNKRYGFAYTDGSGYGVRNLYFDNNLTYYPPPYFPTGTVYKLDLWEDIK